MTCAIASSVGAPPEWVTAAKNARSLAVSLGRYKMVTETHPKTYAFKFPTETVGRTHGRVLVCRHSLETAIVGAASAYYPIVTSKMRWRDGWTSTVSLTNRDVASAEKGTLMLRMKTGQGHARGHCVLFTLPVAPTPALSMLYQQNTGAK